MIPLDCILYKQMEKEDHRPQGRGHGGCLSILLFFLLSTSSLSLATDKPDHYCNDPASWQQWEKLLNDNPTDDGIASLYAFRVGLCTMVKSEQIETDRATALFEALRETVLKGADEEQKKSRRDMGI
jgi:hypothetical protein